MSTGTAEAPTTNGEVTVVENRPQPPARARLVVQDEGPLAFLMDTARFEHMQRIAESMAASSFVPLHLVAEKNGQNWNPLPWKQQLANCFLVVNQSMRWGCDPFMVAAETYVVANKLGYQGKLVAAIVNTRAKLAAPLATIYNSGKGDDLAGVIFGSRTAITKDAFPPLKEYAATESGDAYTDLMAMGVLCIRITVGQAKTDNKMWKSDPQQKLFYSGATKWARRHAPETLQGIQTDDDVDHIVATEARRIPDTTPAITQEFATKSDSLAARLEAQNKLNENRGEESQVVPGAGEESQVEPKGLSQSTIIERLKARVEVAMDAEALRKIDQDAEAIEDKAAKQDIVVRVGKRRTEILAMKEKNSGKLPGT